MKRLHVELVLALQFDKAHRRPGHRLRDPLGVAIVVLLRLDIRANIFGRHQPDIVAVSGEHATEMMSAAAGLHPDNARRKLLRQSNQRLPPYLATHNDRAGRIQPNHAADVLAEVDAKHRDIHPFLLLIRRRAYDAGRRGGPFHKTSHARLEGSSRRSARDAGGRDMVPGRGPNWPEERPRAPVGPARNAAYTAC